MDITQEGGRARLASRPLGVCVFHSLAPGRDSGMTRRAGGKYKGAARANQQELAGLSTGRYLALPVMAVGDGIGPLQMGAGGTPEATGVNREVRGMRLPRNFYYSFVI